MAHGDRASRDTRGSSDEKDVHYELSKSQVHRASRTRFGWAITSSVFLIIAVAFLIAVEIGSTGLSNGRTNIYFIKLDLSHVVPVSIPNSVLINSIARTLGLHDFYTVGLWGLCEGYIGQGFTDCTTPQALYYFDPVTVITNQLLRGASSKPACFPLRGSPD